jgi:nicotinate-nucleotide--dimethylbenzimidazole phosphoribosyltransferase
MPTTPDTTPDTALDDAIRAAIDGKTKPQGALGRIEEVAAQIARLQGCVAPRMSHCRLVLFAADHGLSQEGVSAFPPEVTRQMVLNFAGGGAAANVFARAGAIDLAVVNAGVRGGAFGLPGVIDRPMGEGTANCRHAPAMSPETCAAAMRAGRDIASAGVCEALALGEMGIANTSAATLIAHRLLGLPIADLVGRGTGLDDAGLAHKREVLGAASARVPREIGPAAALAEFGGFEIAMMTGAMLAAAEARRLVLVDGFIASVAALVAVRMAPEARAAMVFAHHSAEAGHGAVLAALQAQPLLHLGLRLGEGTGAALAWPLVRAAAAMLNEMASFADAGVSGRA